MTSDQLKAAELHTKAAELAEEKRHNLKQERLAAAKQIIEPATSVAASLMKGRSTNMRTTKQNNKTLHIHLNSNRGKKPYTKGGVNNSMAPKSNDMSWYSLNSGLIAKAATVYDRVAPTATRDEPANTQSTRAFVASVPYLLTVGGGRVQQNDPTFATSLGFSSIFKNMFAKITDAIGYAVDFNPGTLGMYHYAACSYYMIANWAIAILRSAYKSDPYLVGLNQCQFRGLTNRTRIQLADVFSNRGIYETALKNELSVAAQAIYLPASFSLRDRLAFLFNNSFKTHDTDLSNVIVNVPAGYYVYIPTQNRLKFCSLSDTQLTTANLIDSFEDILRILRTMRERITSSSVLIRVKGQLIKYAGAAPLFSETDINTNWSPLTPIYSDEFNKQLSHAFVIRDFDNVRFWTGNHVVEKGDGQFELQDDLIGEVCLACSINDRAYSEFDISVTDTDLFVQGYVSGYIPADAAGISLAPTSLIPGAECQGIALTECAQGSSPEQYIPGADSSFVMYFKTNDVTPDDIIYATRLRPVVLESKTVNVPLAGRIKTVTGGIDTMEITVAFVSTAGTEIIGKPTLFTYDVRGGVTNIDRIIVPDNFANSYSTFSFPAGATNWNNISAYQAFGCLPPVYYLDGGHSDATLSMYTNEHGANYIVMTAVQLANINYQALLSLNTSKNVRE